MKTEDWKAVKGWLYFLFIACGMMFYFGLGIMAGHHLLMSRAPTKITIYVSW